MSFSADDHRYMALALRLAERGLYTADPNPRVGCVLVQQGQIVGAGWHEAAGQPHAEVNALREAGNRARGATAYVTLEPCNHHGRTPPCTEALMAAGVSEVVAAVVDPFPANAGCGLERLRAAGITVRTGLMADAARAMNIGFIQRFERGRPWVRVKLASSLDGLTAGADGQSQWITGPSARRDVQHWRARASALLTGIDTVLADDPQLNVRLDADQAGPVRQPLRVIADSRGRLPVTARLLECPGPVLVASCVAASWQRPGVEWWQVPADGQRLDLRQLIEGLARRGVNELHVEAGPTLSGALMAHGLVDELLVYQSPVLIGRGRPLLDLPGMEKFADRLHLELIERRSFGSDWRDRYRVIGAGDP